MRTPLVILLAACAAWLAAGCGLAAQAQLPREGAPWQHADLRYLADPDSHTLVAAYSRVTRADLEIRVDLLSPLQPGSRLLLALDTGEGGARLPIDPSQQARWEILIDAPETGTPSETGLVEPLPSSFRVRIGRDILDSLIFRLPRRQLPGYPDAEALKSFQAAVFLVEPGESGEPAAALRDAAGPFRLDDPPPPAAPLLLAFWDTLPSSTPALALRRWDGAHTGPYGQRHGLRILLNGAEKNGVPIMLLDLARPGPLAVLEALGGLKTVQSMNKNGLVFLPQAVSAGTVTVNGAADYHRLEPGNLWYGLPPDGLTEGRAGFAWLDGPANLVKSEMGLLVPLPGLVDANSGLPDTGADMRGLTTAARSALLKAALTPEEDDFVVLGGSLPASPWGDLLAAGPAFEYIMSHPWIRPLDEDDLLRLPARPGVPRCPDLLCAPQTSPENAPIRQALYQDLQAAPDGLFTRLAWQTYLSLTSPSADPRLADLRSAYLGNVAYLLRAAAWAHKPADESACDEDLDFDGENECVLASVDFFLALSPRGGRLVFAAAQTPSGPAQLIGPRSQLAVGLSDPRDWRPGLGVLSDPQEIPGGFADPEEEQMVYSASHAAGQITFTQGETGAVKRYSLRDGKIIVEVEQPEPTRTRLPVILLDSETHAPGWLARYQEDTSSGAAWAWGMQRGPCLRTRAAQATLSAASFLESRDLLTSPEDPNLAYPKGHYLPFPLAVVEIEAGGSYALEISAAPFQKYFAGFPLGGGCLVEP